MAGPLGEPGAASRRRAATGPRGGIYFFLAAVLHMLPGIVRLD